RPVSRREDVVVGEVELEARDARERAGGGADLCGKVRERREVVPQKGRLARELAARELHAVAGIAREADDDGFALLDGFGHRALDVARAAAGSSAFVTAAGRLRRPGRRPTRGRRGTRGPSGRARTGRSSAGRGSPGGGAPRRTRSSRRASPSGCEAAPSRGR